MARRLRSLRFSGPSPPGNAAPPSDAAQTRRRTEATTRAQSLLLARLVSAAGGRIAVDGVVEDVLRSMDGEEIAKSELAWGIGQLVKRGLVVVIDGEMSATAAGLAAEQDQSPRRDTRPRDAR